MSTRRALSALSLALLWAVVKVVAIWVHVLRPDEYSDTYYYFLQIEKLSEPGRTLATIFPEYPTPAAWLLLLPSGVGDGGFDDYRLGFLILVTAFDALFVALLIARGHAVGVVGWILVTTLAGWLALLRFDIVPAVLAAAALLLLVRRRPAPAAVFLALATAVKVWPVLLFPLLLGQRGRRLRPTLALLGTGGVLALISVASAGWQRLLSPLTYQSRRGLQVEAVAATPAMVARVQDPAYRVFFSEWNAYEVAGPGVDTLLAASDKAVLAGLALSAVLVWWWFRRGAGVEPAVYLALFVIAVTVATSRALSPQYLLWLAAPACVLLGVAWRDPGRWGLWRATATFVLVLVLLALTVWLYPVLYDAWLFENEPFPVRVLVARNVGIVLLCLWLAGCVLRATRPAARHYAERPAGPAAPAEAAGS